MMVAPVDRTAAWRRALRGACPLVRAVYFAIAASLCACGIETNGIVLRRVPEVDASIDSQVAPVDATTEEACPACPRGVVLGDETTTLQPGGEGGTPYLDVCPEGQAVVGYNGSLNPNALMKDGMPITIIGSIQTVCGRLSVDHPAATFATVTAGDTLASRPQKASTWRSVCPENKVVIGFLSGSGVAFDQVAFQCTQLRVAKGPSGDVLSPDMSTIQLLPANGGDAGSSMSSESCPDGKIAQGSNIRAGAWVDAFGLSCATASIVPVDAGACCTTTALQTSTRTVDQPPSP
jgi:hypothetical protein